MPPLLHLPGLVRRLPRGLFPFLCAMPVLTITSPRDRSAKTTTAINVAAELAALGRRVVLLDLDPRAEATTALGGLPVADPWNTSPRAVPFGPGAGTLLLAAGGRGLAGARGPDVATLIDRVAGDADCVIIDTPAGAGTITTAAAELARLHLVPLPPSSEAHVDLRNIAQLRYLVGSPTELRAVFVRVPPGTDTGPLRAAVAEAYPAALLGADVPSDASAAAARHARRVLRLHAPDAPAAQAYRRVAEELASAAL